MSGRSAAARYTKGPVQIADSVWAYLQPDGGWGWSNAGLVGGDGEALLVDTLFDLRLTQEMLASLREVSPAAERIRTVVNTHANGDHCFGNALLQGAEIIASVASAREMADLPPSRLAGFVRAAPSLGATGEFLARIFAPFSFDGIDLVAPTRTFEGALELQVGGRAVRLIEVGPAHTGGDVVVHLPAEGVVFTGDIVFNGSHPVVWAGPVARWIEACKVVLALGAETVVPGHGPLAGPGALEAMKDYFEWLSIEARSRFEAGMGVLDACRDIGLGPYLSWGEPERLAANVAALYRDFGAAVEDEPMALMAAMSSWQART